MKVALVHDWLTTFGGAERVLMTLADMYPDAPIYTMVYDEKLATFLPKLRQRIVHTSFIQKLPLGLRYYRHYLPLMPLAIEQFDFQEYDLVISSSHAVAKGIITRPNTRHICYCHTPMRYAWDLYHFYLANPQIVRKFGKYVMPFLLHHLRMWDYCSAERVDDFVANSKNVEQRIRKYYRRKATVIYPPVPVAITKPKGFDKEDFFVVLSRLVPQKNVELAVKACTKLKKKLVVIGEGSERTKLEQCAGATITFLGFQPYCVIHEYFEKAQALLFPCEDDFGMTPVEAMALETPVIALRKGGALETVQEGITGEFFDVPTVDSLIEVIETFDHTKYNACELRNHAMLFDEAVFRKNFSDHVVRFSQ